MKAVEVPEAKKSTTTPATKKARKPNLSQKEWTEAKTLWESGEVTYSDLAKKFDRHEQSFIRYFNRHGIKKGTNRAKHMKRVEAQVEKAALNDAAIVAARIKETKEEHYKMASGLAKLTWAEVLKTKQDGVPVATALNNLKALDTAMTVLKKAREERYSVLGLDRPDAIDENDVPELVISELTAEQIAALRERSFNDIGDLEDVDVSNLDDEGGEVVEED